MSTQIASFGLWPARGLWLLVPLLLGPGFSETARAAEIGLWAAWFTGFVALLAPSTVSLTVVRTISPALPLLLAVAAVFSGWTSWVAVGLVYGLLLNLVIFLPTTGDPMVNGSSYGPERRFALRPPAATLVGTVQLTWLITVAGVVTGPVLIVSGYLVLGLVLTGVGLFLAWRTIESLHLLARRWVVFVPAGFVLHDRWTMVDPMLIQKRQGPSLSPAHESDSAEPGTIDISAGAMGLALLVAVDGPIPFAIRDGRDVITESASRVVFTPSLPGLVMAEARNRGISIG